MARPRGAAVLNLRIRATPAVPVIVPVGPFPVGGDSVLPRIGEAGHPAPYDGETAIRVAVNARRLTA
ncbi:hypothetical protein [Haloplanus sp.]|uniref:hypothetical protein n=1 Tax=Haloplanus sp. TaxID=1961696 RepID=UPI00260449AE|nr:hypothetical protein [Haloplanus sp.]